MMCWPTGPVDPAYMPAKLRDIQKRLIDEDVHRWLPVIVPDWRRPIGRPRGRHRRPRP